MDDEFCFPKLQLVNCEYSKLPRADDEFSKHCECNILVKGSI